MAASHREQIIALLGSKGEMHSKEIYDSMSEVNKNTLKKELGKLKRDGEVVTPRGRSWYRLPTDTSSVSTKTRPDEKLDQVSKQLRSAEDNEIATSQLLNDYDELCQEWRDDNDINFEKRLEKFKLLTLVGDKLMKRWALVHVGYDTNTRQAQEDAKAKTEAREQEALESAPLEDRITVVGHYQEGMKEILEHLPKKEVEESKV